MIYQMTMSGMREYVTTTKGGKRGEGSHQMELNKSKM